MLRNKKLNASNYIDVGGPSAAIQRLLEHFDERNFDGEEMAVIRSPSSSNALRWRS